MEEDIMIVFGAAVIAGEGFARPSVIVNTSTVATVISIVVKVETVYL